MISRKVQRTESGFTAAEMLVTMALGTAIIGAAAIGFATIARFTGHAGDAVTVTLTAAQLANYYNRAGTTIDTPVAPCPSTGGTIDLLDPTKTAATTAEDMRERFLADTQTATAVFCLARTDINTYRPDSIPYIPDVDPFPDNSDKFRLLLMRKGVVASTLYSASQRPFLDTTIAPIQNSSIFVLGYSGSFSTLKVTAIYDIDIVKVSGPDGFYASVKRFGPTSTVGTTLTAYYHVFYPGFNGTGLDGNPKTWPVTTDKFAPLWVSFERLGRADASPPESTTIERFKKARERPFYFIWWPDPSAKDFGLHGASNTSYPPTDPRNGYNHMAGRTSFMFCVPVFPSL